jgi:septal ring factor EnvC (AmiA/AmiB activator)
MTNPDNKASLGCGTLILIALIVMIFGNSNGGDNKKISDQLNSLQTEIGQLRSSVEKQSDTLKKIEKSLSEINERSKGPQIQPRPRVVSPANPEAPLPEN